MYQLKLGVMSYPSCLGGIALHLTQSSTLTALSPAHPLWSRTNFTFLLWTPLFGDNLPEAELWELDKIYHYSGSSILQGLNVHLV